MALSLSDFVVVEQRFQVPAFAIFNDAIPPGGVVIRFDDDGDVAEADDAVARLKFVVPFLSGMSELVVERARVEVRGRRIDQAAVSVAKWGSSAYLDLTGRPGGVRRIDLRGLAVQPGDPDDVQLSATSGSPSAYRWRRQDGEIEFSRSPGGKQLHLMIRPHDGSGFGPPQTAVPHYDMPDNRGNLYGPVLAGASLTLDDPTAGSARVTFAPPVDSERNQLYLGTNDENGAHSGLPHEASPVSWTATEVLGIWASAPSDVELVAELEGAEPVPVGTFPGEMSTTPSTVDFTPGARALLTQGYGASTGADLLVVVEATSTTAGELVATSLELSAHYRLQSVGADGVQVSLRGSPESIDIPKAAGLTPARLTLTVDGSFGPAVRAAASDGDRPGRRSGLRLADAAQGARRMTLTGTERGRPMARLSVYGRSDEPTELILRLVKDQSGRMGAPLFEPVAIQIPPSLDPRWHRADLVVPTEAPASDAVWVTAQTSAGRFWWFADPQDEVASPTARDAMASADGGATWSTIASRPVVQVHYLTERPEPAPISLRAPSGLLTEDILALPAVRSRLETTLLDAIQRGLAGDGTPPAALGAQTAALTFRQESVQPISDLSVLAGSGDHLTLTFDGARDADFRLLDAVLTYDPWATA